MDFIMALLPFALIMVLMYFMMIRPQKKAQQKQQNMLDSLKKGDAVVTIGGLHGTIDEVRDADKTVVIDCEGIFLTFERRAIARVVVSASADSVDVLGDNTPSDSEEK